MRFDLGSSGADCPGAVADGAGQTVAVPRVVVRIVLVMVGAGRVCVVPGSVTTTVVTEVTPGIMLTTVLVPPRAIVVVT